MLTNKKITIALAASLLGLLSGTSCLATDQPVATWPVTIYVQSSQSQVAPNSEIVAKVLIDSSQPINVVDLVLTYPKNLLKPVSINDSESIVDVWQQRDWNSGDGVIKLSGGMLKPFSGTGGMIAEFRLQALGVGDAQFGFSLADAYYADGSGTKVAANQNSAQVAISANASLFYAPQKDDVVPPVFEVVQNYDNPAGGNPAVAFEVKDAGSGVAKVSLRYMDWFTFSSWQEVVSPVQLPPGAWQYELLAVDNSGNKTIKISYVAQEIFKKTLGVLVVLLLLGLVVYSILRKWVFRKKSP